MSPSQPDDDPLTLALMPPPDETLEQRQAREAAEAEAKRVSDEIDEQIKRERENERRKRRPVKLLLLGKSLHLYAVVRCKMLIQNIRRSERKWKDCNFEEFVLCSHTASR